MICKTSFIFIFSLLFVWNLSHPISSFLLSISLPYPRIFLWHAHACVFSPPPLPGLTLNCPRSPPGRVWPQRWREAGEVCGGERWGMEPTCDCYSEQSSPSALAALRASTLCLTYNSLPSPLPRAHPSSAGEQPNARSRTPHAQGFGDDHNREVSLRQGCLAVPCSLRLD